MTEQKTHLKRNPVALLEVEFAMLDQGPVDRSVPRRLRAFQIARKDAVAPFRERLLERMARNLVPARVCVCGKE